MVPLTKHLAGYNRKTFASDANAGLVVGMVTIPQAIAYALLAGVPPEAGLYACLLPMILYSLFGSSKHLVVGPVAIAALLIGFKSKHEAASRPPRRQKNDPFRRRAPSPLPPAP